MAKLYYNINVIEKKFSIPQEVSHATKTLEKAGFEAYLVGGCIRDLLIGRKPKDWDIATNAVPEKIKSLFEETFYNNEYGTVGIVTQSDDPSLKVIQITPYRVESKYSNARHPDSVKFGTSLDEDLKRRDFTINAIAWSDKSGLVDPYKGQEDIKDKIVRAVGNPEERFEEDALRIMRAVRIACELGFTIEENTAKSIKKTSKNLEKIADERIRDEFVRILESASPREGILLLDELGILSHILPEILEGKGVDQNQAHKYDVFEHNLRSLEHAAHKMFPLHIRIAALLHDVSKPETRRWSEEKKDWTFYGHDVVGGRKTKKILTRLKFDNETIDMVSRLVRWHMFFSDPDKITLSAVRRMIRNVGKEHIWNLMNLRVCDRIGTGRPKEHPYRFRKYKSMVEEALRDPVTVGMLAIDGNDLISLLKIEPGPRIGWILHALLEVVLDDPTQNTKENLEILAQKLSLLDDEELKTKGESGKESKEKADEEELQEIRKRHSVS